MRSGLVAFDDDPRGWKDDRTDGVDTAWTHGRASHRPGPTTGSNVASRIRVQREPAPDPSPSDGTLALVAVAAGVSVVSVVGVGIVGIGVVAASLARPPAVPAASPPPAIVNVAANTATSQWQPQSGPTGTARAPVAQAPVAQAPVAPPLAPQGSGWSGTTPAAAVPPAAAPASDGWFGGVVAAGSEIVSRVVGEPSGSAPPPSLGGVVGRTAASVELRGEAAPIEADDGLREVRNEPRDAGWTASAPADDAAAALLAELDAPGFPLGTGLPGAPPLSAPVPARSSPTTAAAVPDPTPAEPVHEADDGWFDAVLAAGSGLADAITGQSPAAPPRPPPPSLAAAMRPAAAPAASGDLLADDDGLTSIGRSADRSDGFGTPSSADDAAMALLAELDRDLPLRPAVAPGVSSGGPPTPAVPPPAPSPAADDTSWLDAVVDAGATLRSFVTGEPAPMALPDVPSGTTGAAAARVAQAVGTPAQPDAPVDLLADDDGLGTLGSGRSVAEATGGFGSAAAADDPALALLAELERDGGARVPLPSAPSAPAIAAPPSAPSPAGEDLSWLDTVSSVGSAIGDGLSGLVGGGGGPARAPVAVDPSTSTALDAVGATSPSVARPDAEDAGWFDAMLQAGSDIVANAVGADEGLVVEPAKPAVDLLADDDGLGTLPGSAADRTDGFGTASAADDPALALLAELDAPSPGDSRSEGRSGPGLSPRAGSPEDLALDDAPIVSTSFAAPPPSNSGGGPPPPAGYVAPPSLASVGVGVASSGTSAARTASDAWSPAPPPAPPAPAVASDDSWLDALTTQVVSLVSGPSTSSAARPSPMAPATPSRSGPPVDLLAGDDGLDSLVADLSRDDDGWQRGSAPDDAAMALLAELDAPSLPRTGSPAAAPGSLPRTTASAPAPVPEPEDSWFDSVVAVGSAIASYVSTPAPSAAAPSAPAPSGPSLASLSTFLTAEPVPTAPSFAPRPTPPRSAGRPVDLLADGDANLRGIGDAPIDTRPVDEWVNPTLGPRPPEVAVAAAMGLPSTGGTAARPCAEGEACDQALRAYRDDPASGTDLLAQEDLFVGPLQGNEPVVAELFSGNDDPVVERDAAGMFAMRDYLLIVNTDVPGIPIEIDGKRIGVAPLVAEIPPGPHQVRLIGGGDTISEFALRVDADPQEWCFQARGRQFKYVRCP